MKVTSTMNTKWLEDFIVLADCQKFTSAAHMRWSSQAAFSRRIQQLEEHLGQVLFNRGKSPIHLTSAGKKLYPIAIEMIEMSKRCKTDLETVEPLLAIASLNTLACSFLPHYLEKINTGLKNKLVISVDTSSKFTSSYQGSLLSERFDCLLLYRNENTATIYDALVYDVVDIAQDKLIWVCTSDLKLDIKNRKDIPHLAYAKHAQLRELSQTMLRDITRKHSLKVNFKANISESIKAMAISGHGVACLPLSCIKEEVASEKLVQIWPKSEQILNIVMIKLKRNNTDNINILLGDFNN